MSQRNPRARSRRPAPGPAPERCRVNGCTELLFSKRYCLAHEVRLLRILEKHQTIRERNERTRAALLSAAGALDAPLPPIEAALLRARRAAGHGHAA